ncbi:PDZ and LIM domain protein 2 isoform X3 [Bicyclus anynana]|uniref:PDZ and LIM domain protein 2 isoform X3 n=1 Tax=Bicyclus anynana TaxID=110368 RepID=A0A6J1NWR6_BICAN|nr:PDZ and LIM domain protein 2 isoform X3 [Bicyclus anynana]
MGRLHTFVVTLRRDTRDANWGLRLVGGADLATPLIVTMVTPGTPAGRELARGDIIAKIDHYDARDLRHEDAQNLFKNAPNQIKLVVQRGRPSSHLYTLPRSSSYSFAGRIPTPTFYRLYEEADHEGPRAQLAVRPPAQNAVPPPFRTPSPLPSPWRGPESLPRSTPVPTQQFPHQFQQQVDGEYRTLLISPSGNRNDEVVDESINSQPYRTTPLVLPGAKVRREPGPTESYLRHHPNPAMRAPPHHDYRDTLMKQKVAESVLQRVGEDTNKVVHKQFNSPINLYSDQNIANSIRQQTSPLPHKPTVLYDPAKSETYRALQEGATEPAHEVAEPPQTKVFSAPAAKPKPAPPPKQQEAPKGKQTTFVNSLQEEHIQQSHSFKRLMYNVLGNSEF